MCPPHDATGAIDYRVFNRSPQPKLFEVSSPITPKAKCLRGPTAHLMTSLSYSKLVPFTTSLLSLHHSIRADGIHKDSHDFGAIENLPYFARQK